jgi:hypothetical protein
MVLPPPAHTRATVALGDESYIDIPTPADLADIDLPEPAQGLLPVYEQLTLASASRHVARSSDTATVTTSISSDTGEIVHPTNGMVWREIHDSTATIAADDPLSFVCDEQVTVLRRRAGIETRCVATGRLSATAEVWCVAAALTAFEDDRVVFDHSWAEDIRRDHQ